MFGLLCCDATAVEEVQLTAVAAAACEQKEQNESENSYASGAD